MEKKKKVKHLPNYSIFPLDSELHVTEVACNITQDNLFLCKAKLYTCYNWKALATSEENNKRLAQCINSTAVQHDTPLT